MSGALLAGAVLAAPSVAFVAARAALRWRHLDRRARERLAARCAAFVVLDFLACAGMVVGHGSLGLTGVACVVTTLAATALLSRVAASAWPRS